MKRLLLLVLLTFFLCSHQLIAQDKSVYFFSPKHLKTSLAHEILFSPFMHHARSKRKANYFIGGSTTIRPQPVYNRIYSFLTTTYQPKLRLVEFGNKLSLTLRIPMSFSLSTVDLRTKNKLRYIPSPLAEYDINRSSYSLRRTSALGVFNAEIGGLIGFDVGQGATVENTSKLGLSLSVGYNLIYAPLFFNQLDIQARSDYKSLLSWTTLVAQIGIHRNRFSLYYMAGINPTRVNYYNNSGFEETVMTDTYHRVSIGIKLGK